MTVQCNKRHDAHVYGYFKNMTIGNNNYTPIYIRPNRHNAHAHAYDNDVREASGHASRAKNDALLLPGGPYHKRERELHALI